MRSVEVFRYVIFAATICWGSWVQLAPAAEALETPKLSEAAKSGWLSFGLVSGRISLTGSRFGSINSTSSNNGRTERLTIRVTPTGPAVKYAMTGSKGEFSLEVFSGDQLSIAWKPVGEAAVPVRLQQRAGEPIGLTIGPEKQEETYRASSLWHLLIAKPAVCREHLLPLLHVFQFEMDPAGMADEIESMLLTADAPVVTPDRESWAALVAKLGAESFADREAADRELREAGRMVATYLERLDLKQFDTEQQYRIRRIIQSMSPGTGSDRPEQVAAWLAGDSSLWVSLLDREEEAVRRVAAERLASLLGRPVVFDPAADAATRTAQIRQLKAQLD